MAPDSTAQTKIDAYLGALRTALRSLPEAQARDVVEEIRSHIRDAADTGGGLDAGSVVAVLDRLGSASELAELYLAENLTQRAGQSRSPWLIIRSAFHWAKLSVAGALALFGSVVGYGLAASFAFCALAKPFNPHRVGLWRLADENHSFSLHLGFGPAPAGTELLGWWMIPVGLAIGATLLLLTSWFGLTRIRALQRRRPLPSR